MGKRNKGFREVNACIHLLQEVQARGALDPRQEERLSRAITVLRKANRRDARTDRQVLSAVRAIAEVLWEALSRETEGTRAE